MSKKGKTTAEICQMVTDIVIEGLEKDICPWTKPWQSAQIGGTPQNYGSKREYHSSNRIVLTSVMMAKGYDFNYWVTYKGAKNLGGNIKKGEKGVPVVFWKFIERTKTDDNGVEEEVRIPFLRYFTVWNISQCENIEMPKKTKKKKNAPLKAIKEAEAVVKTYDEREDSLTIKIQESERAYFQPSEDLIVCPTMREHVEMAKKLKQTVTDGKQHFYSTLFHEMVHSTGTKDRCNREGVAGINHFGSHEYSKEELVAEIGSAVLGAKVGLTSERVMENTTAYCKGWAKKLKSEPKWIVWAGGRSEKAVNYILEGK
jgi:antirestriction protein ArdC